MRPFFFQLPDLGVGQQLAGVAAGGVGQAEFLGRDELLLVLFIVNEITRGEGDPAEGIFAQAVLVAVAQQQFVGDALAQVTGRDAGRDFKGYGFARSHQGRGAGGHGAPGFGLLQDARQGAGR